MFFNSQPNRLKIGDILLIECLSQFNTFPTQSLNTASSPIEANLERSPEEIESDFFFPDSLVDSVLFLPGSEVESVFFFTGS